MSNLHELEVWNIGLRLVQIVYESTRNYPESERFGLVSQTNRCVVSIPSNIAEGIGRKYKNEMIRFLFISRGSLYELETLLIIAKANAFLEAAKFGEIQTLLVECRAKLNALINYFQHSKISSPSHNSER